MGQKKMTRKKVAPPIIKPSSSTQVGNHPGSLRLYYAADVVEDREFKTLLPERSIQEMNDLETTILKNGVEEPLDIWFHDGKRIVADGYSRLKICKKHNLRFPIRIRDFKTRDEVKLWMIKHQLERRNVTSTEKAYLIGFEYHRLKKNPELEVLENDTEARGGQNDHSTQQTGIQILTQGGQNDRPEQIEGKVADRLALRHNIGEKTVRRYEQVFIALSHIGKHNDALRLLIAKEQTTVTSNDLERFAQLEEMPQVNEADEIKAALKEKPKPAKKKMFLPNLNKEWKKTYSLVERYHKDPSKGKAQKEALESIDRMLEELSGLKQKIKHGE